MALLQRVDADGVLRKQDLGCIHRGTCCGVLIFVCFSSERSVCDDMPFNLQFEIEFFRGVAQKLRWTPDKIDWKCMGWEELIQDIQDYGGTNGNGTCDFAVAGFAAKSVS